MLQQMLLKADAEGADVVIGDLTFVFPEREEIYAASDWDGDRITSLNSYLTSSWTCIWGCIAYKSLYDKYKLCCPKGITYCEDFHLMVRLCYYAKKVVNVHRPFYYYRQQEGSVMHNLNKRTEQDEQWVYQDIIRFFKE